MEHGKKLEKMILKEFTPEDKEYYYSGRHYQTFPIPLLEPKEPIPYPRHPDIDFVFQLATPGGISRKGGPFEVKCPYGSGLYTDCYEPHLRTEDCKECRHRKFK